MIAAVAVLIAGGVAAVVNERRRSSSGEPESVDAEDVEVTSDGSATPADSSFEPGGVVAAPLPEPRRSVTPNGGFNAPRWKIGNSTTGNKNKVAPGAPVDHYHQGVDLAASAGEPILAMADGTIGDVYAPGSPNGRYCMNGIRLNLPDGRRIIYCDVGEVLTYKGASVKVGDAIGIIGSRGFVHIAIKKGDDVLDPINLFPYKGSNV